MSPPPFSDAHGQGREGAVLDRIAEVQGVINVAHGELLALVGEAIGEGWAGGAGILSPGRWLAVRAGIAPGQAQAIVRIAQRAGELPHSVAALERGALGPDA